MNIDPEQRLVSEVYDSKSFVPMPEDEKLVTAYSDDEETLKKLRNDLLHAGYTRMEVPTGKRYGK